jgi:CheY-like chemotaxis protein
MSEFNLREVCKNLLDELELAFGKQNLVNLHIDLKLADQYQGQSSLLTLPVKALASFLADNLVNGVILIELLQKSQSDAKDSIQVNIVGKGIPEAGVSALHKSPDQLQAEMQSLGKALFQKISIQVLENNIILGFTASLKHPDTTVEKDEQVFKNKKVLIAEDNDINVMVFSDFLEDWGIAWTVASNGREAVELLKSTYFDAVLMDIHMPVMDGIQATRLLREFNVKLPVIVLSAFTHKNAIEDALAAGANEYLKKPVSSQELYTALNKFL